jgi:AraC-like DNA-binding protein
MMTKITSIIEKDRVYFNPEYRLNDLANSCNISVHKVSQVINHIEGVSFSDFINRYRIEEAKKMLISEKNKTYTILAIAHEVGFNSKTAFYNAFKKLCKISPSAYIKENKS